MRATLVHNASAGAGRPSKEELTALLEDSGYSLVHCGAKDEDLPKVLARATGIVIAAGGDGTVGRVAIALKDREIPMAILPLGTANNIARVFGIHGTVEEIVAGWRKPLENTLDICVAEGRFGKRRFVEAVGIGALAGATSLKIRDEANLVKRVERGRDAFRKALSEVEPVEVDISVDGRRTKGEMLLVEIMNIGFVGPNLHLAPEAKPGDGQLDVVFVAADQRDEMLEWLENPDVQHPPVTVETGRSVIVGKNGAPLRIGDKASPKSKGDVLVRIEDLKQAIILPSIDRGERPSRQGKRK